MRRIVLGAILSMLLLAVPQRAAAHAPCRGLITRQQAEHVLHHHVRLKQSGQGCFILQQGPYIDLSAVVRTRSQFTSEKNSIRAHDTSEPPFYTDNVVTDLRGFNDPAYSVDSKTPPQTFMYASNLGSERRWVSVWHKDWDISAGAEANWGQKLPSIAALKKIVSAVLRHSKVVRKSPV